MSDPIYITPTRVDTRAAVAVMAPVMAFLALVLVAGGVVTAVAYRTNESVLGPMIGIGVVVVLLLVACAGALLAAFANAE